MWLLTACNISVSLSILNWIKTEITFYTPGKLSQVPPRRYRLNGCDRYPELPVMVKTRHKKIGVRLFLIKYTITREFTENERVLFDPYRHKVLSHVISPRTFHIYQRYDL